MTDDGQTDSHGGFHSREWINHEKGQMYNRQADTQTDGQRNRQAGGFSQTLEIPSQTLEIPSQDLEIPTRDLENPSHLSQSRRLDSGAVERDEADVETVCVCV